MTNDEQRRLIALVEAMSITASPELQVQARSLIGECSVRKPLTKDEGIEKVANKHAEWIAMAVAEIERLTNEHDQITADDLRHLIAPNGSCMGAAFRKAALRGLIRPVDVVPSNASTSRGHLLRIWEAVR